MTTDFRVQPEDVITPTSITLVRKDPLPNLPAAVNGLRRLRGFAEAVSLVATTKTDKDKFRPDATTRQRHVSRRQFTMLPIPRGATVTDHSFRRPRVLQFTGIITQTPFLDFTSAARLAGRVNGLSRVQDQLRILRGFEDSGEPLFVATSIKPYENMAIASLVEEKTQDTGAAVQVSIVMQEILTVDQLEVEPVPDTLYDQLGLTPASTATSTAN